MITNPYRVLGIDDNASIKEATEAYKKLAKKYHPDLNPDSEYAAEKMAEINAAYDQIKSGKVNNENSYGYGTYSSNTNNSGAPDYYQSIRSFLRHSQYRQALNLLNSIEDRNAEWYYLCAVAYAGLNNRDMALQNAKTAMNIEPSNPKYRRAYESIANGQNVNNYENPFENFAGYSGAPFTTYTTTTRSSGGCLGRIIKFLFILFIIRMVFRLLFSFPVPNSTQNNSQNDESTTSSYGDYGDYNNYGNYGNYENSSNYNNSENSNSSNLNG